MDPQMTRRTQRRWSLSHWAAGVAAAMSLAATGCQVEPSTPVQVPEGEPELGRQAIAEYGCGACHVVPGVRGADGTVAAPLTDFGRRHYIAGRLVNNADNLAEWVRDPQRLVPGTAMPDLGVGEQEARDIAAYLLSLR